MTAAVTTSAVSLHDADLPPNQTAPTPPPPGHAELAGVLAELAELAVDAEMAARMTDTAEWRAEIAQQQHALRSRAIGLCQSTGPHQDHGCPRCTMPQSHLVASP
jgi:hypothetical protein